MKQPTYGESRIHWAWWTLILIVVTTAFVLVSSALFAGTFKSYVPVTLTSDRAGLVMESNAKVKMRGVQVGRVATIQGGREPVRLQLQIYPDQIEYIPANVGAQIKATTAFGAKYVELTYPENPSPKRLAAGAVLKSSNVSTEVNTVFENLVKLLKQIDASKLNAVLTAVAEGVGGKGERIGQAITDANQVLLAINPRSETIRQDLHSLKGFSDTYDAAAQDIIATLDAASTTSTTITNHSAALDTLLVNAIGLSQAGINLLGPNKDNLVRAVNVLEPTTNLLHKYNPEYTCMLVGAKNWLDTGGYPSNGGNGRSTILDTAILLGNDPYIYPDNLPIVAAKGGPGGKPGCGSLPDAAKNFPVRALVTNTGWGTGVDLRPNPGIGHPFYADYFPVTRAVPEPPSIRPKDLWPAPGPIPYPGAPPYGAPLYGPGGVPLWPGVPPAPPPPPPPPGPTSAEGTPP
jgi:phospholipid/cholesterol/gamma-HCH transport system substrate-binding protein